MRMGRIADPAEDLYDHACILLAAAHAHKIGNASAPRSARRHGASSRRILPARTMAVSVKLPAAPRRAAPIRTCICWNRVWPGIEATGDSQWLTRSAAIVDLFKSQFFDADTWTLGEYFNDDWSPCRWATKGVGQSPATISNGPGCWSNMPKPRDAPDLIKFARKLYASAIANGLNRATGLAYDAVSKDGLPLVRTSRSWPQTEAIKAAIALDGTGGPDMKPEIESRVGRLFRWHIDPAPQGMWIDLIDERGRNKAQDVPASIFYHLVCALTAYLAAKGE